MGTEHFHWGDHEGLLEEVTFEQRPQCEVVKGKHSRQRRHRYKRLGKGKGSVCVRTRKGCSDGSLVTRGASGPGGMQLEREEKVRPCG